MSRFKGLAALIISGLFFFSGAYLQAAEQSEQATEQEKISYVLGYSIINNLNKDFQVDLDSLIEGIKDGQAGTVKMSQEEMRETMASFQRQLQQRQMEQRRETAAANKAAGEEFLQANREKEGVVALKSGLQYKVLKEGHGPSPSASDTVKCHYEGSTIDGEVFDSSYQRGEPASFKVNGVIPGWTEALQLMRTGSQWMLYIPSDLAYGDQGAGETIEPGSTLIFQVELLGINEQEEAVQ